MTPILTVKNITKVFNIQGSPFFALKGVDLTIEKGEIFGVIGMSGAGKSTLVRTLIGLETPTEGEVWIGNEEVTGSDEVNLREIRKKIGMVFQHFNLFRSRDALHNVAFPLEAAGLPTKKRKEKAHDLLALVGLKGKEKLYPSQLSGGEKQRVAIARALANDPILLLCDEATSALDPRSTTSILDLLKELNRKLEVTCLLITHEMEVVKRVCHRLAILEHGAIVEKGPVVDLFSRPNHPTTKYFLQQLSHAIPEHFLPLKEGGELLRLSFKGSKAQEPIISRLIRSVDVDINILLGEVDSLQETVVGCLVIESFGSLENRSKARLFLEERGVAVEVIG